MSEIKKIAVYGARGYTGIECCRLVDEHPHFRLSAVQSSQEDWSITQEIMTLSQAPEHLSEQELIEKSSDYDGVLLAASAEKAFELRPKLRSKLVVDLSGAFRLGVEDSQKHYSLEQPSAAYVAESIYGLCPWAKSSDHDFISNPGCYPSAVLMALLPLLKAELVADDRIVIDAKSGVTGAGRSPKSATSLAEISESVLPYKVFSHQHEPEIRRYLQHFGGAKPEFVFTTTLLPIQRGILASIYLKLKDGVSEADVENAFAEAYAAYPLVDYRELKASLASDLSLSSVSRSPMTKLRWSRRGQELVLFSMIDNLQKGAASQAVENLNRCFSLPIQTGLLKSSSV